MNYRVIPAEENPRADHFKYFLSMPNPFLTVTVQVDITQWLARIKKEGRPFFLSFLYDVSAAANSVPELRRRIRDGKIIEYCVCGASYTVALDDGTYRYCDIRTDLPFAEYLEKAQAAQKEVLKEEHLTESEDPESRFFVSCLPWTSYSAVSLPQPALYNSVPNIIWGRYYKENRLAEKDGVPTVEERVKIPVTLMVSHALADGLHVSRFFASLEKRLAGEELQHTL